MLLSASGNTIAILNIWPVLFNMLRIPDAEPRVWGSTELMIAFVFGETNKPEPPPIRAMKIANNQYGVNWVTVVKPNNPQADTIKPAVANRREPTRSDN